MAKSNIKGWITVGGKHIPLMEGESRADAIKKFTSKSDNKTKSSKKAAEKKVEANKKDDKSSKLSKLNTKLNTELDKLEFDDLHSLFKNTKEPDVRERLMNRMQEKDVVKFGKEIYGIDMKNVNYKGSFEDAVSNVDKLNSDKAFKSQIVYHGTNATFDKFNYDNFGKSDRGDFGQGIYTTTDKSTASKYGKNVKEVEIKYKNPLVLNNDNDISKFNSKYGDEWGEAKSLYSSKQLAVSIMNMGYDAVIDNVYGQIIVYNLNNTTIQKGK